MNKGLGSGSEEQRKNVHWTAREGPPPQGQKIRPNPLVKAINSWVMRPPIYSVPMGQTISKVPHSPDVRPSKQYFSIRKDAPQDEYKPFYIIHEKEGV